jgi:hypothetical protein
MSNTKADPEPRGLLSGAGSLCHAILHNPHIRNGGYDDAPCRLVPSIIAQVGAGSNIQLVGIELLPIEANLLALCAFRKNPAANRKLAHRYK